MVASDVYSVDRTPWEPPRLPDYDPVRFEHYGCVPKRVRENLLFRQRLVEQCYEDKSYQVDVEQMCREDLLFFVNVFCFTYNPRMQAGRRELPFITYHFQDHVFQRMEEHYEAQSGSLALDKCRDMGMSWACIIFTLHKWLYEDMFSGLLISRKEDLVDSPGNPGTLFWKIDYLIDGLPPFMVPPMHRSSGHIENLRNGSVVDAESSNQSASAGDRRSLIVLDEMARMDKSFAIDSASVDVSDCRFLVSSHYGINNAFFEHTRGDDTATPKIDIDWWLHPTKGEGCYLDGTGKVRSPWYDWRESQSSHPADMAENVDRDPISTDQQFYGTDMIRKYIEKHCFQPIHQGRLLVNTADAKVDKFVENEVGELKLWGFLDHPEDPEHSPPVPGDYVIAVDPSMGTGGKYSANAVIAVFDSDTKQRVAEFVSKHLPPTELAVYAVAIARWFKNVNGGPGLLIWEANGPGASFGTAVLKTGFRKFYYRQNMDVIGRPSTERPGWWSTPAAKTELLTHHRDALKDELMVECSRDCLQECLAIIFEAKSRQLVHQASLNTLSSSEGGDNHADRVIASALAWFVMSGKGQVALPKKPKAPIGSVAWDMEQRAKELNGRKKLSY